MFATMVESLTIKRVKGLFSLPTCPYVRKLTCPMKKNLKGHLEIINGGKGYS